MALEALALSPSLLPFAVLIGVYALLRRSAHGRARDAPSSPEPGAWRGLAPVVRFSAGAATLCLALSLAAAPWAARTRNALLAGGAASAPWQAPRPGAVLRMGGWNLAAREVSPGGDRLEGVALGPPGGADVVFARRARVRPVEASGEIELLLEDGATLPAPASGEDGVRFDRLRARLPARAPAGAVPEAWRREGLGLNELGARARAFAPHPGERASRAGRAWHRRLAAPLETLLFGALAVALFRVRSRPRRRFARSADLALGLAGAAFAGGLLALGAVGLRAGALGPAASVWLPIATLLALAAAAAIRSPGAGRGGRRAAPGAPGDPARDPAAPAAPGAARGPALHPRRHALSRWVAWRFLGLAAGCLCALLAGALAWDLVVRAGWLDARGASAAARIAVYAARLPWLAAAVGPGSLAVAASLLASRMAADGSLTGMRASGISAARGLWPALAVCALLAPAPLLLRAGEAPWRAAPRSGAADPAPSRQWRLGADWLFAADAIAPHGEAARGLVLYRLDDAGMPIRRIDAPAGRAVGGGLWRLEDARRVDVGGGSPGDAEGPRFVHLGEAPWARADPSGLGTGDLLTTAAELGHAGFDATPVRAALHARLEQTLACVAGPALALLLCLAPPAPLAPLPAAVIGGAVAALQPLLARASALAAASSPIVAGWLPGLLLCAAAGLLGVRAGRRWG